MSQWVELFDIDRGNVNEITIFGSLAVWLGNRVFSVGGEAVCVGRSLMKPFQIKLLVRDLSDLPGPQRAIAISSHMGEPGQLQCLEGLQRNRVDMDWLGNPEAVPMGAPADLSRKSKLSHPCSGKHLAILYACRKRGWTIVDYLSESHPYNQEFRKSLESRLGRALGRSLPDGCGLPTWPLTIIEMAKLYRDLAGEADQDWIAETMLKYPEIIGGVGRLDTAIMREGFGVIAKEGAGGLIGLAGRARQVPFGAVVKLAHGFDPEMAAHVIRPLLAKLEKTTTHPNAFHGQTKAWSKEMALLLARLSNEEVD